jgi:sugar phosphate permease
MTNVFPRETLRYRRLIFWILAAGYVLVFFHRLCPAVVAVNMMRDLKTAGALLGILGSAYFYPYALMQIPAGLLSDSWGPRHTITTFLVIASVGSFLLASAPSAGWAIAGRIMVGLGVSTLFVSTLKVLSQWFHNREFASMTGILMAMGGLGSLLAASPLAHLSNWLGWRFSFVIVGAFTLLVVILVRLFVRDAPPEPDRSSSEESSGEDPATISLREGMGMALRNRAFWPLAAWFFFNCAIFFSFIGLWGGPYLIHCYGMDKAAAGRLLSVSAVGLIVGSPFLSYLSTSVFQGRKPVLVLSSIAALLLTAPLTFATGNLPIPMLYFICFGLGFTSGAVVAIAFTATKELFPVRIAGTATGLVNLFPFAGGAVFQPVLGALLERNGRVAGAFTSTGYREAFLALFLCAVLALLASLLMRETMQRT